MDNLRPVNPLLDYPLINELDRFINELIKAIALAYKGSAKKAVG
jgi:hypothetical protein